MTKKRDIHDPYYQMRDFFIDESMRRLIPKNPYNIIYLIDNEFTNQYDNLKKDCIVAISHDKNIETYGLPSQIKEKLLDDNFVLKRIKQLHKDYQVDINTLATKIVRVGSPFLVESLFDMGMNPNYIDENGLCGIVACLKRRKPKLLNLYLSHPGININTKTPEGDNITFLALEYRNWKFLKRIVKENPALLREKNNKGEIFLDILNKVNKGENLWEGLKTKDGKYYKEPVPSDLFENFIKIVHYLEQNGNQLDISKYNADIQYLIIESRKRQLEENLQIKSHLKLIKL